MWYDRLAQIKPLQQFFNDEREFIGKEIMKAKSKRGIRLAFQLGLIIAIYYLGVFIASLLPIRLPGNILGMLLLLVFLGTGILKAHHVGHACTFLIDRMSIFFLPAGVAIMGCLGLLNGAYLKFGLVCIVTTIIVFMATSYTVVAVSRLMRLHERRKLNKEQAYVAHGTQTVSSGNQSKA